MSSSNIKVGTKMSKVPCPKCGTLTTRSRLAQHQKAKYCQILSEKGCTSISNNRKFVNGLIIAGLPNRYIMRK